MVILGITDLGINLPVLLFQLVNFTFLLLVLRLLVYKPVLKMLDERRARIQEGLSAADRGREQAIEAERQAQEQIAAARREGQDIVANAQQIAQRLQEEARAQALQQQETMLERARSELQQFLLLLPGAQARPRRPVDVAHRRDPRRAKFALDRRRKVG